MRNILVTTLCAFVLTPPALLSLSIAGAQVMQSSSYRIQSDSINFGGGLSTSTSYRLESTAGEIATGESSSATYQLKAGYQQMQEVYIAMAGFGAVSLSPSIPGISGGFSNGSTTVTVTTDSSSGYSLQVSASQSPAMQKGGDSIADYSPAGAVPDFTFTTDATDAHLGYSPEGVDIDTRFKDDGVGTCGAGGSDTALTCWDGLSTTPRTIAQRTNANHPNGSTTTLNFRVGVGGSVFQPSGTYLATTTITALPL
jgi:hypothetical protein